MHTHKVRQSPQTGAIELAQVGATLEANPENPIKAPGTSQLTKVRH